MADLRAGTKRDITVARIAWSVNAV